MPGVKIHTHATGSTGNAYTIEDAEQKILIDPGIRFKSLQKKTGFTLAMYNFCLLSHEHKDHSKAIDKILSMGIACAMSQGTKEALKLDHPAIRIIQSRKEFVRGNWRILPFLTDHDAAEPLGFLIESPSKKKILFATDTRSINYKFKGVTHFIIECNYEDKMLSENHDLTPKIKNRIRQSHFEFNACKKFFANADLSKTEEIHLIHLSNANSDAEKFKKEIAGITGVPVYSIE